jgi:hypothetical protein
VPEVAGAAPQPANTDCAGGVNLTFPKLSSVSGYAQINASGTVSAQQLTSVQDYLYLEGVGALDFPVLASAGGLTVIGAPLTSLGAPPEMQSGNPELARIHRRCW